MLHRLLYILSSRIDRGINALGRSCAWLTLAMVLLMALIVVMRYVFRTGSISLQESVLYVNALIFAIGAAYTLKEQGHVRVDIFYRKLDAKWQGVIDTAGYLLLLMPSAIFIVYASWDYVAISWQIGEGSAETSGLPYVYLLKSSLIVLPVLLLVQGISELCKTVARFNRGNCE